MIAPGMLSKPQFSAALSTSSPSTPTPPRQVIKCIPILLLVWFLNVRPILAQSPDLKGFAQWVEPGPPSLPGSVALQGARPPRHAARTQFGETKPPWLGLRCRGRIPKRREAIAGSRATEDGAYWLPGLSRHCSQVACQSAFPARKRRLTGKTAVCCSGWQSLKPICTSPRRQKTLCSFFGGVLSEREFLKSHLSGPSS